jgi:hypothetical protein
MRRVADIVCMGALAACAPEPIASSNAPMAPPELVVATLLDDIADVTWQAGDDASRFRVRRSPDGAVFEGTGLHGQFALPELGVAYWFTVEALGVEWSEPSAPSNVVQRLQPARFRPPVMLPPFDVVVTPEPAALLVEWQSGTAEAFIVETDPPDERLNVMGNTRYADLTGLRNGVTYRVGVTALHANLASMTSWSGPVVPAGAPGVATGIWATPHDRSVTVSWTAPADTGGAALTGWDLAASAEGPTLASAAADATSADVSGLANGVPVSFVVRARNRVGRGDASLPSNPVTPAAPSSAPENVAALKLGAGTALVSWTPPKDSGGLPVLSYVIEAEPSGAVENVSGTSVTMGRLPADVAVRFRVTALTEVGAGAASDASEPLLLSN